MPDSLASTALRTALDLARSGDALQAIQVLKDAIAATEDAEMRDRLARCGGAIAGGIDAHATEVAFYRVSVAASPHDAATRLMLGRSLASLLASAEAKDQFDEALRLAKDSNDVDLQSAIEAELARL